MLADTGRTRIEAKVAEIEARTAGEIVVAVVERCDGYPVPRALFTGAVALLAAAGVAIGTATSWSPWAVWPFFAIEIAAAAAAWLFSGLPVMTRLITPVGLRDAMARTRAIQMFSERALYETRDRTGVLILVASREHRVVIVGDRGIHERVGDPGWQRYCERIIASIKDGRLADGILEVLDELGEVMAGKLPPRPDNPNELPNRVVSG